MRVGRYRYRLLWALYVALGAVLNLIASARDR